MNSNFCFEIENTALDLSLCKEYLSREPWTDYLRFGEKYEGFFGIGLTGFADSAEPEIDSLSIYQSVSRVRADKPSDVNWQLMTVPTKHVHGYVGEIFSRFKFTPHRARFAKIDPKRKIGLHTDDYMEGMTRVHWPISSNPQNSMLGYNKDTRKIDKYYFEPGHCYAINTNVVHGFINDSDEERIHLIVNFDIPFEQMKEHITTGLFL